MNRISDDLKAFVDASIETCDLVGETMGLHGGNVLICGANAALSLNDGVKVVRYYNPIDPIKGEAARRVRAACDLTVAEAGDGTTTTAVLLGAFLRAGYDLLQQGVSRRDLTEKWLKLKQEALAWLDANAKKDLDLRHIEAVATIALHGDQESGKAIGSLVHELGRFGALTVERGRGERIETEKIGGMVLEGGYVSPAFATQGASAVLERPLVVVIEEDVDNFNYIKAICMDWLNNYLAKGEWRPLVFVVNHMEGSALSTLSDFQHQSFGRLPVCVCRIKEVGDKRADVLQDLSVVTGAKVFNKLKGGMVHTFDDDFGSCEKVIVTKDRAVFVPENATAEAREAHQKGLEVREVAAVDEEQSWLRVRLSNIQGNVGVVRLPISSAGMFNRYVEMVEDAYRTAFEALNGGVVPGGGSALRGFVIDVLDNQVIDNAKQAFLDCLYAPMNKICANGGYSTLPPQYGLVIDVQTGASVDPYEAGILDSLQAAKSSLKNALDEAIVILQTKKLLVNE